MVPGGSECPLLGVPVGSLYLSCQCTLCATPVYDYTHVMCTVLTPPPPPPGVPLVRLPTICKAPLDLFRVFNSVQELGGFVNVSQSQQTLALPSEKTMVQLPSTFQ